MCSSKAKWGLYYLGWKVQSASQVLYTTSQPATMCVVHLFIKYFHHNIRNSIYFLPSVTLSAVVMTTSRRIHRPDQNKHPTIRRSIEHHARIIMHSYCIKKRSQQEGKKLYCMTTFGARWRDGNKIEAVIS